MAWITEQKNTLSAVFYLSALAAYLRFDRTRGAAWYFGAMGSFVLALLSKTVTANFARRLAGDLLVAARPAVVEEGRVAAGALFPAGGRRGPDHGLVGIADQSLRRPGVRFHACSIGC